MTTTETIVDQISVTELGVVEVRESVITIVDGAPTDQVFKRHCITPGEDYLQEPPVVQEACQSAHTPAVIAAFVALSTPPIATPDELCMRIKNIRAAAQERFTKNSGVTKVYDLNYEAAVLGAADTTTILRNKLTPFQHLHDLGQYAISAQYPAGMTAEQFAAYVIAENRGPAPYTAGAVKMTEIEVEYMRVLYAQPVTEQSVAEYQAFCDARQA